LTLRTLTESFIIRRVLVLLPLFPFLPRYGDDVIVEAVHIRKEGKKSMNRDEGCYMLCHAYDSVLATSSPYRGKNGKGRRRTRIILLVKDSVRVRNVKVKKIPKCQGKKKLGLCFYELFANLTVPTK